MPPDDLDPLSPWRAHRGSADDTPVPGDASAAPEETAEPAQFIEYYDREYYLVVRFIVNCGASLTAAEDAAQDAFLDAWKLMSVPGVRGHHWRAGRHGSSWPGPPPGIRAALDTGTLGCPGYLSGSLT